MIPWRIWGSRYSPIAVSVALPPDGVRIRKRCPTADVVGLGELLLDQRRVAAHLAEQRVAAAVQPLRPVGEPQQARLDAVERVDELVRVRAVDLDLIHVLAHGGVHAGHAADGLLGVGRQRLEALGGDGDVGADELVQAARDRRLEPGGEDRHEDDESEADHQRRGRRRGAAGVAHRVLAREPAGLVERERRAAARSRRRAAARHSGRRARRRRTAGPRRRPARRGGSPAGPPPNRPCTRPRRPSRLTPAAMYGDRRRRRACRSARRRCSAATGGTRVARSAGATAAEQRDPDPDPERQRDRAARRARARSRACRAPRRTARRAPQRCRGRRTARAPRR